GEARCSASQNVQVNVLSERNLLGVNAKHFLAATDIRTAHDHAAVETAGTQQRRVKNIRTVSGSHQDHAVVGLKTVHLDEQLVQRLLTLIVTAAQTGATVTADSVDFIDEDDAGSILLALFEEVAN